MAILSDININNIVNKKDLVIIPYDSSQLTGVGYDLKIGCIVDADYQTSPQCVNGEYFLLGKHRYIIITKEYIWLSRAYMGTLHARGSLSLAGLSTPATTVDPNFKGHMAMCVVNLSDVAVSIKEDDPFITLVIHELKTVTKTPLRTTETGEERTAQRKLNKLFPSEDDVRRKKLNEYFVAQEQLERSKNLDVIIHADLRNHLSDIIKDCCHFVLSKKGEILTWLTTGVLLAIIVLCIYSLVDSSFIGKYIPNYTNTNMFQVPAIIAAIAALIALHRKK